MPVRLHDGPHVSLVRLPAVERVVRHRRLDLRADPHALRHHPLYRLGQARRRPPLGIPRHGKEGAHLLPLGRLGRLSPVPRVHGCLRAVQIQLRGRLQLRQSPCHPPRRALQRSRRRAVELPLEGGRTGESATNLAEAMLGQPTSRVPVDRRQLQHHPATLLAPRHAHEIPEETAGLLPTHLKVSGDPGQPRTDRVLQEARIGEKRPQQRGASRLHPLLHKVPVARVEHLTKFHLTHEGICDGVGLGALHEVRRGSRGTDRLGA